MLLQACVSICCVCTGSRGVEWFSWFRPSILRMPFRYIRAHSLSTGAMNIIVYCVITMGCIGDPSLTEYDDDHLICVYCLSWFFYWLWKIGSFWNRHCRENFPQSLYTSLEICSTQTGSVPQRYCLCKPYFFLTLPPHSQWAFVMLLFPSKPRPRWHVLNQTPPKSAREELQILRKFILFTVVALLSNFLESYAPFSHNYQEKNCICATAHQHTCNCS